MGVYYQARTVIGYKITNVRRYDEIVVPMCEHSFPADAKYCPVCGKKVGPRIQRNLRENWDDFLEFMREETLPHEMVYEDDFEFSDAFWIGYGSEGIEQGGSEMITVRDYDLIKWQIIQFLDPYLKNDLFNLDAASFGIWTLHIGK